MKIILETERLFLRDLEPGDLDNLFALYRDPQVRRYFPDGVLTREQTQAEMETYIQGDPEYPELTLWATIDKVSGRFVGRCGLLPWRTDDNVEVEIAYMLAPDCWRQGLGTEIAQALLEYGFYKLGLPRLTCVIDEHNAASIRVAEKIGMAFDRTGEDEKGPYVVYARERPFR
jgi:[ribosomal protein S5]-alanine N-acetyltransferase